MTFPTAHRGSGVRFGETGNRTLTHNPWKLTWGLPGVFSGSHSCLLVHFSTLDVLAIPLSGKKVTKIKKTSITQTRIIAYSLLEPWSLEQGQEELQRPTTHVSSCGHESVRLALKLWDSQHIRESWQDCNNTHDTCSQANHTAEHSPFYFVMKAGRKLTRQLHLWAVKL